MLDIVAPLVVLGDIETHGFVFRKHSKAHDCVEDFQQYQQTLISRYEYRWLRYFDALGIGDNAARRLLENCTAITKNYALAYGRGELDRPAAISAVLKSLVALISAELPAR